MWEYSPCRAALRMCRRYFTALFEGCVDVAIATPTLDKKREKIKK
jgi:hypothetical protein